MCLCLHVEVLTADGICIHTGRSALPMHSFHHGDKWNDGAAGSSSGPLPAGSWGTPAPCPCAAHPAIAQSWLGCDLQLAPSVLRCQACILGSTVSGGTVPAGARQSFLCSVAVGVFGCRLNNLHSITEAGSIGRIFLLVFSQPKPTCLNYDLGSVSLEASKVSKTQTSLKMFPSGAVLRAA